MKISHWMLAAENYKFIISLFVTDSNLIEDKDLKIFNWNFTEIIYSQNEENFRALKSLNFMQLKAYLYNVNTIHLMV